MQTGHFTRPHCSPSGVSAGQIIPHCEGCKARGPATLRLFSNWDFTRILRFQARRFCTLPADSFSFSDLQSSRGSSIQRKTYMRI